VFFPFVLVRPLTVVLIVWSFGVIVRMLNEDSARFARRVRTGRRVRPGTMPTLRTIAAQPKDKPAPEALPEAPKLDPKNTHVALSRTRASSSNRTQTRSSCACW